jgi:hypothetical protein
VDIKTSFVMGCSWCDSLLGSSMSVSNNLVGTIPPEIYHLSSLKRLALVENCLQSTLPYEMFQLTRLSDIDLSWNYLSDTVPDELYVLKSLAQLRLHGNQDEGNCNRGRTYIYVESQSLVGNILETNIDKLRNLKILEVYMNNFNGHLNRLGMYLQVLNIG